jgi:predicted TIM-barrel fold metal-dependent hydrolase
MTSSDPRSIAGASASTVPPRPDFPVIDGHTHLFYDRPALGRLFEERDMRAVVINITGRRFFREPVERRWAAMVEMKSTRPDRIALCTTFDPLEIAEPGFARNIIAALERDIEQGASMVKVWKDIGLEARDAGGEYVQIDDPRFRPVWDFLARREIPLIAHIAEPRACWEPLDRRSPHYTYYRDNPQYHAFNHPEMPRWERVIAARDRWIEANPGLVIIGAHFGSNEHDVAEVAERLDRFPNYFVDTAERFDDLFIQPREHVRNFFLRYRDRIIYGTDVIFDEPPSAVPIEVADEQVGRYATLLDAHWNYLAGAGNTRVHDKTVDPITVTGLDLPQEVLEAVLHDNAVRIMGVPA